MRSTKLRYTYQDSLDHCPLPINVDQCRSKSWHWSELIDIGINGRILIDIDRHWALIEESCHINTIWRVAYILLGILVAFKIIKFLYIIHSTILLKEFSGICLINNKYQPTYSHHYSRKLGTRLLYSMTATFIQHKTIPWIITGQVIFIFQT